MWWAIPAFVAAIFCFISAGTVSNKNSQDSRDDFNMGLCFVAGVLLILLGGTVLNGTSRGYPATEMLNASRGEFYEVLDQTDVDGKYYLLARAPGSDLHYIKAGTPRLYEIESPLPEDTLFVKVENGKFVPYAFRAEHH